MAKGKIVLAVDDNPAVTRFVESVLRPLGYRVETASDGVEALQRVTQGPVDLILLDFVMPRMNGFHFCKVLEEKGLAKGVPVVLLSSAEERVAERMREHTRVVDFLPKPVKAGVLRQVVEKHLAAASSPDEGAHESGADESQGFEDLGDIEAFEEFDGTPTPQPSPEMPAEPPPKPDALVSIAELVAVLREMMQNAVAAGLALRLDEITAAASRKEMLDIIDETVAGVVDDDLLARLIEKVRSSS